MASAGGPLDEDTLAAALTAAGRRWPQVEGQPIGLLAGPDDLDAARELAAHPLLTIADVRQVGGLPDGWALAWTLVEPRGEG
jgi:hypothetical protein